MCGIQARVHDLQESPDNDLITALCENVEMYIPGKKELHKYF